MTPGALPVNEPERPDDAVEVGRVVGAWGIQGGIKVKPFAADPQALFSSKRWFLLPPDGPAARPGAALPSLLRIVKAREQGDPVVATAQELPDRTAAEALKGARVFVSRGSFPTPDEGEFYWVDLIGCTVLNRQGRTLGTVENLIETGPHCVLIIRPADPEAPEVLIPFVDAYVDRADTAGRRIEVDWGDDY
ncbi:MAG: ribosome maturation factor RimM [Rubrivivax sp.]